MNMMLVKLQIVSVPTIVSAFTSRKLYDRAELTKYVYRCWMYELGATYLTVISSGRMKWRKKCLEKVT